MQICCEFHSEETRCDASLLRTAPSAGGDAALAFSSAADVMADYCLIVHPE